MALLRLGRRRLARAGCAPGPRRCARRAARPPPRAPGRRGARRRSPPLPRRVSLAVDPGEVRPFAVSDSRPRNPRSTSTDTHSNCRRERLDPNADAALHAAEAALDLARARGPALVRALGTPTRMRGGERLEPRRLLLDLGVDRPAPPSGAGRNVDRPASRAASAGTGSCGRSPTAAAGSRSAPTAGPRSRPESRKNWRSCVSTVGLPSREDTTTASPRHRARGTQTTSPGRSRRRSSTSSRRPWSRARRSSSRSRRAFSR